VREVGSTSACRRCTRVAVDQIIDFEISVHHYGVVAFLGNARYLAGKGLLQLHKRRDNNRLNTTSFQCGVAVVVPDGKS
jgi:hypothetical protein